jgi:hypothetical protein
MAERNGHYEQQAAGGPAAGDGKTRRRVLAGVAGVLGVAAAEVAGTAGPAQANNGNPVLQGTDNGYPTKRTAVFTPNNNEVGILADPSQSGKGSLGVYGIGQDAGVRGDGGSGAGFGVIGAGSSSSGVLTVPAGKSSATQTGVALTVASLLLATVQQNLSGVSVRAAVPNVTGSKFTVYLSKAPSVNTKVAWFLVN